MALCKNCGARIADEANIPVKIRVTAGDEVFEKSIRVPNLLIAQIHFIRLTFLQIHNLPPQLGRI